MAHRADQKWASSRGGVRPGPGIRSFEARFGSHLRMRVVDGGPDARDLLLALREKCADRRKRGRSTILQSRPIAGLPLSRSAPPTPSPSRDSSAKGGSRVEGFGDLVLPEGQVICMSRQLSLADAWSMRGSGRTTKLSRIDALIDWSQAGGSGVGAAERRDGAASVCSAVDAEGALPAGAVRPLRSGAGGGARSTGCRSAASAASRSTSATPDETTICRFRLAAAKAGVLERCLAEVNRQLDQRGLMLKKGTLMDASIVAATHKPPRRKAGMGAGHRREPGADWTSQERQILLRLQAACRRRRGLRSHPQSRLHVRPHPRQRHG